MKKPLLVLLILLLTTFLYAGTSNRTNTRLGGGNLATGRPQMLIDGANHNFQIDGAGHYLLISE